MAYRAFPYEHIRTPPIVNERLNMVLYRTESQTCGGVHIGSPGGSLRLVEPVEHCRGNAVLPWASPKAHGTVEYLLFEIAASCVVLTSRSMRLTRPMHTCFHGSFLFFAGSFDAPCGPFCLPSRRQAKTGEKRRDKSAGWRE